MRVGVADMPRAPKTCVVQRCGNPASPGSGRCEPHRLEQRKASDQRRPTAHQRGYDQRWQRTRTAYLAAHPTCECGCGGKATDVDHIDGLGPNGPHGHDWQNLQALTASCHAQKTARHDGSFGRKVNRLTPDH